MKKILFIILVSITLLSCVATKKPSNTLTHFALEDHTFEESCAYFDSCYRANNLEVITELSK